MYYAHDGCVATLSKSFKRYCLASCTDDWSMDTDSQ